MKGHFDGQMDVNATDSDPPRPRVRHCDGRFYLFISHFCFCAPGPLGLYSLTDAIGYERQLFFYLLYSSSEKWEYCGPSFPLDAIKPFILTPRCATGDMRAATNVPTHSKRREIN